MSHADFERFNREQEELGKKTAANPRNLAAGTLRQLDAAVTKQRGLKMFVFNVQQGPDALMREHIAGLDRLEELGIATSWHRKCFTAQEILDAIDEIADMREKLPYDIDGAVVKLDETALRSDFPGGSKYSAGHIAYKYPPEERIVVMDEIEVDVGRTGKLTFTGIFHDRETGKPARLCGTMVSRATLHNQDYIREMQVGIGGEYRLFKSGEIIPKLNGCVKAPQQIFEAPTHCPVCGEKLVREADTADIRCVSPACPAQLVRTIAYFASLDCMNIMGLGDKQIEALIRAGYVHNFADIYTLHEKRDALVEQKLIGKEKNTEKILAAIEDSKQNEAARLLTALGIRNVGRNTAKDIMKHFASLQELMDATRDTLININDVGETTADCILEFFSSETNRETVERMREYGVNMLQQKTAGATQKLAGLTIVVTGTLPTYGRK